MVPVLLGHAVVSKRVGRCGGHVRRLVSNSPGGGVLGAGLASKSVGVDTPLFVTFHLQALCFGFAGRGFGLARTAAALADDVDDEGTEEESTYGGTTGIDGDAGSLGEFVEFFG